MRIDNLVPFLGHNMSSGWTPGKLSDEEIADGEAYHRAQYQSGGINQPANCHKESIDPLIEEAIDNISRGHWLFTMAPIDQVRSTFILARTSECLLGGVPKRIPHLPLDLFRNVLLKRSLSILATLDSGLLLSLGV